MQSKDLLLTANQHAHTLTMPLNGTKVQRDFFTAFHGSMRQGWTGTMQQLSEFLGK